MKFSICIPNFNYAHYLGSTLRSVLDQPVSDFEVVISDNCSTDASVEVIRGMNDPRISVFVNACNVGFAGNLDRAARHAAGEFMLMLSSDDLMGKSALTTYDHLISSLGNGATRAVFSSSMSQIDSDGLLTGKVGIPSVWTSSDLDRTLSQEIGADVYRVNAKALLQRSLQSMTNPFNFAATLYPRTLYQAVEGYGGGRLINPDKWFHWRLLGEASEAYFIDQPLFSYRWHSSNQTALQKSSGALKYLVDEYTNTLEASNELLKAAGMTRDELIAAFLERDILRHGLATFARGDHQKAARIFDFGKAVYPDQMRNLKSRAASLVVRGAPWASGLLAKANESGLGRTLFSRT